MQPWTRYQSLCSRGSTQHFQGWLLPSTWRIASLPSSTHAHVCSKVWSSSHNPNKHQLGRTDGYWGGGGMTARAFPEQHLEKSALVSKMWTKSAGSAMAKKRPSEEKRSERMAPMHPRRTLTACSGFRTSQSRVQQSCKQTLSLKRGHSGPSRPAKWL